MTEKHLLFAVLAFESELLDLAQPSGDCPCVPVYEVHCGGWPFGTMKLVKGEALSLMSNRSLSEFLFIVRLSPSKSLVESAADVRHARTANFGSPASVAR